MRTVNPHSEILHPCPPPWVASAPQESAIIRSGHTMQHSQPGLGMDGWMHGWMGSTHLSPCGSRKRVSIRHVMPTIIIIMMIIILVLSRPGTVASPKRANVPCMGARNEWRRWPRLGAEAKRSEEKRSEEKRREEKRREEKSSAASLGQ